jgi:hypothetical protein
MARGAYQVLALTGAYLTGPSRGMLQKLAQKYLGEPAQSGPAR